MAIRARIAFVALALAGCGDRSEPVPDPTPVPVASGTPSPLPTASFTAPQIGSTVPDRVTVSTNEPFYMAEIDGDRITLTGVSTPRRELTVLDREVAVDSRRWRARDDLGDLIVTVTRTGCADDMSGAPRDFAGTLTLDEHLVRGCAFTGKPAPPPGEGAGTIPANFVGAWNVDAAACARPATSIDGVKVTPNELLFHESAGRVTKVEPLAPDRIRITADYDGEGERWTATQTLRISGDRLTIDTGGRPFSRVRCRAS